MATKATASAASASNGASSAASVIRSSPSTPHQNSSGTMAKISESSLMQLVSSLPPCRESRALWNQDLCDKNGRCHSKIFVQAGHMHLKSVHFKKPVTGSSFLSKNVVIFNITTTNMTTTFERNEDRVTGFLK